MSFFGSDTPHILINMVRLHRPIGQI